MNHKMLGFFSGFPAHSFPDDIAEQLSEALTNRKSLVFISAWPAEYERNDSDSKGMHEMFEKCNMPFEHYYVIDNRTDSSYAVQLINEASCVFLMGGHPEQQFELICSKGLDTAIRDTSAVILGVSAGAINMAKRSLDTKESCVPYDGLGLADITVKPHFELENQQVLSTLLQISMNLPICAMEDESAIFVKDSRISYTGQIHWISKGTICLFSPQNLLL